MISSTQGRVVRVLRVLLLAALTLCAMVVMPVSITEGVVARLNGPLEAWVVIVILGIWLFSSMVPAVLISRGLWLSFSERQPQVRLRRIVATYLSTIFGFAGFYYSAALVGDYTDAYAKYNYYGESYDAHVQLKKSIYRIDYWPQPLINKRAFSGIHERLFSGVDWPFDPDSSLRDLEKVPPEVMQLAARQPAEKIIRFTPEARLPVLFACVHFSVVTITTLGYGDLVPGNLATRLAADIEVLIGIALLVIALGMVFGKWEI